MKLVFTLSCLLAAGWLSSAVAQSNTNWPKSVTASDGSTVKMYEWETESVSGNELKARAAFSIITRGKSDPVFGVVWITAQLEDNGQSKTVRSVDIKTVKLPGESVQDEADLVQSTLEKEIPSWNLSFTNEELNSDLRLNQQQEQLSRSISNAPPEILYTTKPSILVSIDGSPRLQQNTEWGLETVINSPFTIIKNKDGRFYLYGGKHWYSATSATGPYNYIQQAPQNLVAIESAINESYKDNNNSAGEKNDYTISSIVVTTRPAELIQTNGEAKFSAVEGTELLYVKNTDDDIFMDVNTQSYYVLLAGRWYKSKTLSGDWKFVEADNLPADFARIPGNSEKADVLASVAGTNEATDAIQDAQVPQTAKVDRNNTNLDVVYDGDPEFENIDGTSMQYATNSPYSVLRYRNRYYAVDNGVWFESRSARGPWIVSVERPYDVVYISPRYPVYHVKYVYIYDVYPDYVYMGYTPGYLNTYVYGPTIVYGTGYHYRPWYRQYYFPRPCTWGYNMRYSRWYGWGFGININVGWVNVGIGNGWWGYSRCGWWGPTAYRPNYCYRGGYYGYNNRYYGGRNNVYINNTYINYNNNVYNNRRGIATRDVQRYGDNRRRDWANNNGNYRNSNRDNNRGNYDNSRDRKFNGRGYGNNNNGNAGNNNNGRYNNRNREYNRPGNVSPGNNGNNNGNNRIGDNEIRRRENADRPQRQYNPQPENRTPNRNFDNNNGNGNRQPERRVRQYESNPGGNNSGNRGGGYNNNNGNSGGNNRQFERRENSNSGNSGGGRPAQQNNNNGNGGGRSGRRGG